MPDLPHFREQNTKSPAKVPVLATGSRRPKDPRNTLHCRFCDWVTTKWNGPGKNGWNRLRNHVEDDHPAEFDRIGQHLGEEEGEDA